MICRMQHLLLHSPSSSSVGILTTYNAKFFVFLINLASKGFVLIQTPSVSSSYKCIMLIFCRIFCKWWVFSEDVCWSRALLLQPWSCDRKAEYRNPLKLSRRAPCSIQKMWIIWNKCRAHCESLVNVILITLVYVTNMAVVFLSEFSYFSGSNSDCIFTPCVSFYTFLQTPNLTVWLRWATKVASRFTAKSHLWFWFILPFQPITFLVTD